MSNAWTEGEWHVYKDRFNGGVSLAIGNDIGGTIMSADYLGIDRHSEIPSKQQANAELIALAPRMAAAIQAYAHNIRGSGRWLYVIEAEIDAINQKHGGRE